MQGGLGGGLGAAWGATVGGLQRGLFALRPGILRLVGPSGLFARTWSTGSIALCVAAVLGGYLLLYFL